MRKLFLFGLATIAVQGTPGWDLNTAFQAGTVQIDAAETASYYFEDWATKPLVVRLVTPGKNFYLLLDTGSNFSIIRSDVARAFPQLFQTAQVKQHQFFQLSRARLFNYELAGVLFFSSPEWDERGRMEGLDGIIGMNIISRIVLSFNTRDNLILTGPAAKRLAHVYSVSYEDLGGFLSLEAHVGPAHGHLVLDTGNAVRPQFFGLPLYGPTYLSLAQLPAGTSLKTYPLVGLPTLLFTTQSFGSGPQIGWTDQLVVGGEPVPHLFFEASDFSLGQTDGANWGILSSVLFFDQDVELNLPAGRISLEHSLSASLDRAIWAKYDFWGLNLDQVATGTNQASDTPSGPYSPVYAVVKGSVMDESGVRPGDGLSLHDFMRLTTAAFAASEKGREAVVQTFEGKPLRVIRQGQVVTLTLKPGFPFDKDGPLGP